MLAALSRKHIASAGRLGSGPALGPQDPRFKRCGWRKPAWTTDMARITASVYSSHVPAIGAALDLGKTTEPYWQPVFAGYEPSKRWFDNNRPDVVFLVYNDHATAFSL